MVKPDLTNLCKLTPEGAVYFPTTETLIIADLHLGWEPSMTTNKLLFADEIIEAVVDKFERLIETYVPENVIFNGDIIQRRTKEKQAVNDGLEKLQECLETRDINSVLVSGNHDPKTLLSGRKLQRFTEVEGVTVFHGKEPIKATDTHYICAHLHPMMSKEKENSCFVTVTNTTPEFQVLIMPAFNPYLNGLPVDEINWDYMPFQMTDFTVQKISLTEI